MIRRARLAPASSHARARPVEHPISTLAMAAMTRAHGALGARARAKTNELAAFGRTPMATRTRRVGGTTRARRRAVDARASAAVIKVIGCGGGGGNAVNRMISSGLQVGRASWRRVWRARFKRDDEAAGRGRALDDALDERRADAND